MEPVFEKEFPVRTYEVDASGRVRPTAFLNYLQEAAGDHARILGIAVRQLMLRGLTWVISRMHLKLIGMAASREVLRVRTWPSLREGRFTCREFEVVAADGTTIALATCSFAVLDLSTRRPVIVSDHLPDYPLLPRRAINDDFVSLPRLDNPEAELSFRVGRGDLDMNHHVNNVVYAGWGLETVPAPVAECCSLAELEISYRAEALYGQTVVARSRRLDENGDPAFLHQLVREEDGAELTRLVSRWGKCPDTDDR